MPTPWQSAFDSGTSPSFWTQKVKATIYGLYYITPYGPIGLGYVDWQRNIEQPQPTRIPEAPTFAPFATRP